MWISSNGPLVGKQAELEALQGSAASAAQKKAVTALQAEVEKFKKEVDALVGQWQQQKDASDSLQKTKQAIEEQTAALTLAESQGNVAKAAELRYGSLKYLEQQRTDLEAQVQKVSGGKPLVPDQVLPEHVAEVIGERVGIPINRMLESERDRLLKMEERIV